MKILEYIIRATDKTREGSKSAEETAERTTRGILGNMAHIQAAWQMGAGIVKTAATAMWTALKEAFKFETLTVQFSVLMGSMSKAKDRMAELASFAAQTPFSMEEVVTASRQLHVFTNGTLGASESLKLVGDAAGATGQSLQEVAFWVGRAYSMIKGGQPFGEAAMRLQEMGLITPEVRTKMEDLQAAGASNIDVWSVLERRLSEFGGGMEKLSQTGGGLTSTLKDNWTAAVREFGNAFQDVAKDQIKTFSDVLDNLVSSGKLKGWLSAVITGFRDVGTAAATAAEKVSNSWVGKKIGNIKTQLGALGTYAVARGTGSTSEEAESAANTFFAQHGNGAAQERAANKLGFSLKDPGAAEMWKELNSGKHGPNEQSKLEAAFMARYGTDKNARADALKQLGGSVAIDQEKALKVEDVLKDKKLAVADQVNDKNEKAEKKIGDLKKKIADDMAKSGESETAKKRRMNDALENLREDKDKTGDRVAKAREAAKLAWDEYKDPELRKKNREEREKDADFRKEYGRDIAKLKERYKDLDAITPDKVAGMRDWEQRAMSVYAGDKEKATAEQHLAEIEKATKETADKIAGRLVMK